MLKNNNFCICSGCLKTDLTSSSAMSELITQAGVLALLDFHSESYSTRGSCAQPVGCSLSLLQNPHHHCAVQCNRPPIQMLGLQDSQSRPNKKSQCSSPGIEPGTFCIRFPDSTPTPLQLATHHFNSLLRLLY